MTNKHQVLRLLAKGLTPQQVAARLGCCDGYVRATRQRATEKGAEDRRRWERERYWRNREARA